MTVEPADAATIAASSTGVYADRSGRNSMDAQGLLAHVGNGVLVVSAAPDNALEMWCSSFVDSGPLTAADGSLWVTETNNLNVVGAVRIDPTGALTRFADTLPRCADAGGAVFLSGPASAFSAGTEMRVWQSGKATTPLPVSGIASGGYRMSLQPPPEMFAGDPGSVWAFTAAGLQHLRGQGNPMTFKLDDSLYVVDRKNPRPPEYKAGWEHMGIRDYNATALSKLGYFVLVRDDNTVPSPSIPIPGFSLHLVPVPNVPTTQPNEATH